MTSIGAVKLSSRRLILETFDEACISREYLAWLNDGEVMRFSNQRFRSHTAESAREYVDSFVRTANIFLAIRLSENGRMIGTMTAYIAAPHGTADMGLLIGDRSCWGRGYGHEAWNTLMSELFLTRGLRKVTGGMVRPNIGMGHIMRRSGMHLEAVRSRQEIVDGSEEDVLFFARFVDR